MTMARWIVAGCFTWALASPVRAFDSLDDIKADLAKCSGCLHRNLLQARLNYRFKMIQAAETSMAGIAGRVPGTDTRMRGAVAGVAGNLAANAGINGSGAPAPSRGAQEALRGQTAMSAYVSVYGTSEINPAEFRLSIEQQLRELGIDVLPHTAPPSYPVFNLTIKVGTGSQTRTTTNYDPTMPKGLRNQTKTTSVPLPLTMSRPSSGALFPALPRPTIPSGMRPFGRSPAAGKWGKWRQSASPTKP